MERTFKVEGMSCVNCARTIEIALKNRDGVKNVEVSFELGRVKVEFDEETVSEDQLIRTIESLGYKVIHGEEESKDLIVLGFCFLGSLYFVLSMVLDPLADPLIQALVSIAVQIVGGFKFYKGAYSSLKNKVAGMDVLVALGTSGSLLYSLLAWAGLIEGDPFFETNVFLITFVRLGRFIEDRMKKKALAKLKALLSAQSSEVKVLEGEREVKKRAQEVSKGEKIVLRTGDTVLLDCKVIKGEVLVSEAVITGEPEPIHKRPGDKIVSGSEVINGYAVAEVENVFLSSYLARIGDLIDKAISEKPKVQRLADRISHYFVLGVLAVSVLTFVGWFYTSGNLPLSVNFSLAVLVVSCPCALGIATPLAIMVGLSKALQKGVIIKKPSSVEIFPKVDTVVLDKTGTLTEGKFKIKDYTLKDNKALDVAFTMELASDHPVAQTIRSFAKEKGAKEVDLGPCREIVGKGVQCGEYFIGDGGTKNGVKEVVLKKGNEVIAVFRLEDAIKEEAPKVVKELKALGLYVMILSGDRKEKAQEVGKTLGVDRVIAEVGPEDKRKVVESLQGEGKVVAMVGDGVNDAPALAQADLSFAVGGGTDIAKKTGDVVLISGIKSLPYAFKIGLRVYSKIKQNLFWAFLYNALSIPVAMGLFYKWGLVLKPEIAGLMMALSSLSVVSNTLLLMKD